MPSFWSACSLAIALGLAAAPIASADPPRPWVSPALDRTTTSAHFAIHSGAATSPATATALAAAGERALATYARLGFPPPVDDGDGHVDVYVMRPPATARTAVGVARPDPAAVGPKSGAIVIRPEVASAPDAIAHELFHLVQRAIARDLPGWMRESTAEWAAATVTGEPRRLGYLRAPGTPLDCASVAAAGCGGDPGGYRRWVFFEALAERFGPSAIRDVLALSAVDGGIDAIQGALAARGTDLAGALAELAARMASGTFTHPGLAGRTAWVTANVATGIPGTPVADQALIVDHDALAFAALRGTSARCAPATLELTVDAPAGVPFRALLAGRGRTAEPLTVTGARATGTFAWSTCTTAHALLAIVNAGAADVQSFVVHARVLPGDPAARPPAEGGPSGVPRDEPSRLYDLRVRSRVARARRGPATVTFTVRSSGAGRVHAAITTATGTVSRVVRDVRLHRGRNQLSLRVPANWRPHRAILRLRPYVAPTADAPDGPTWGRAVSLDLTFKT